MKRSSLVVRAGLALAALAVPVVLTGCSGSSSVDTQGVTSLSVMDYYTSQPYVGDALDTCAAKAGVKLNHQAFAGTNSAYISKVLQQVSSKTLPDLLMIDNPFVQTIAATGALVPLSDFNVSTADFPKGVLQAGSYKGKVYGLQPFANTQAFFYNKDLLAEAGVQPPTTWDELKAAAAKLTHGDQYGMTFYAHADSGGTNTFLPWMWTNGGDEKKIATPQNAEALQLWVDLVKSGSASSSVLNGSAPEEQFAAGKAAMMEAGSYVIPTLEKVPDLNYGIINLPGKSASNRPVSILGGEHWTVPQTGNKAKEAKAVQIVACLNTDEMQLSLAKASGVMVPTKTSVAAKFNADNPELKVFADLIKTARGPAAQLGADWPNTEVAIHTAIQTAITGQASPLDALRQAQNSK